VLIELLTIGDELLLGFTLDSNGAHIARELSALGVEVVRRTSVGDDASAIAAAVRDALDRTGAVITTGGLGPTADDITKPAIAAVFGRALVPNEELWEALRQRWKSFGRTGEPPAANRQQIMIPAGATVLVNRHGSAPGVWLEDDRGRWCAMLPGVPREMRAMLPEVIVPRLRERIGAESRVVRSRVLRTTGIAESALPELLGELTAGVNGMPLAYLPSQEGVDLRLTARADPADADAKLADAVAKLRQCVGRYAYGEGTEDLAEVVLQLCRTRHKHIAVGESCTGGMLGMRLTAIPGSSDVVAGGVISYSNWSKSEFLGVDSAVIDERGAVSEDVARQMAAGACARFGTEIGVGITGVAGPDGGTPEKPVGLVWIAVCVDGDVRAHASRLFGDRAEIRFRSTQVALDMIRRALAA
jgi:nicotinamide-nucleotide amidase